MKLQKVSALGLFVIITRFATAKDNNIVMMWPSTGAATLKVTFGKFRELSSYSGRHDYTEDVTVENVSSNNIPSRPLPSTCWTRTRSGSPILSCRSKTSDPGSR